MDVKKHIKELDKKVALAITVLENLRFGLFKDTATVNNYIDEAIIILNKEIKTRK